MAIAKPITPNLDDWQPKTELGRKVKNHEITDMAYILDNIYIKNNRIYKLNSIITYKILYVFQKRYNSG